MKLNNIICIIYLDFYNALASCRSTGVRFTFKKCFAFRTAEYSGFPGNRRTQAAAPDFETCSAHIYLLKS